MPGPSILERLMSLYGYKELYPPQEAAVRAGVLEGRSLLVATPTASGKTFIGALALASRLAATGGGLGFYLVPLKSIASEKYEYLGRLSQLGLKVRLEVGDTSVGPSNPDIIVATYEKLDSLLRSRPGLAGRVRVIVVDEVHYIGDSKRGVVLESIIANTLTATPEEPQIVALSATVPNAAEIAEWLGATPIVVDWRPVPLREAVYKDGILYYPREGVEARIPQHGGNPYLDPVLDTVEGGGQVLVFSQSRRRTVQLAKRTAKHVKRYADRRRAQALARRILETGGPRIVRETLASLVLAGVAFHHAGLSSEQRRIIEEGFRSGIIRVIHATPTLAAGVNLPARRVVVEEYYRYEEGYRQPIPVFEYKQLAGRAGRPGLDSVGEAVIVASPGDTPGEVAGYYILGEPEPVRSRLEGIQGLRHVVLGMLAFHGGLDRNGIMGVVRRTLYYRQAGSGSRVLSQVERALLELESWGLTVEDREGLLRPTPLGLEIARLYLDPYSVVIARRLRERAGSLNVDIALYMIASMPDMVRLPAGGRREQEALLDRMIDEAPDLVDIVDWFGPSEARTFKTMLLLKYWINEKSEDEIHAVLGAGPGDLNAVVETARWIAGSLARISPLLGFTSEEESLLRHLEARIRYGVKPELLPLVVIPGVGRVRARRLYEAGYKTLADLASASPRELLAVKGIGPAVVRQILEYLGRGEEAEKIPGGRGEGLEAYF
ncbi:MAG: DEAD/DEAH box helicase [Desulfurococcales archaeon]|nr:DEAD/DEAH box helicase [Desulfurococcales archaeon]